MNLTCAEARATIEPLLTERLADVDAALLLCMDNAVEVDADTPALAAAAHIGTCPACRAWLDLDGRYPERVQWRERMARYCCSSMFGAMTQEDAALRIASFYDRDSELYWLMGDGVSVSFCPWCGTKLPNQPFEEGL